MLLVIVTGCDVPRLTNQKQVGSQLTPVVSLLPLVQPFPVEMDEIMLDPGPHGVGKGVLVVDELICPANVSLELIYEFRESPVSLLHGFSESRVVAHLLREERGEGERGERGERRERERGREGEGGERKEDD